MNWIVLLVGASVMLSLGLILDNKTDMSVAFGLLWMGLAAKVGN